MDPTLISAARHVPKLLRHQLLCNLTTQYLNEAWDEVGREASSSGGLGSGKEPKRAVPSLQRFYGAILFVDISGFTNLCNKLDIDGLKIHINEYFKRMLEVVNKWDGDVIKFAGDAVYIVWPTEYSVHGEGILQTIREASTMSRGHQADGTALNLMRDNRFVTSARNVLEKAVACAMGKYLHFSSNILIELYQT